MSFIRFRAVKDSKPLKRIMKKSKLLTGLFATSFLIILASSCKKDNNTAAGAGSINATINGTAWQSQITEVGHWQSGLLLSSTFTKSGDTTYISIQLHDSTKVGNENDIFSNTINTVSYTRATNSSASFYSSNRDLSHGVLTLTTRDLTNRKVTGTFSGVLYNLENDKDSVKIENGQFNATYKED